MDVDGLRDLQVGSRCNVVIEIKDRIWNFMMSYQMKMVTRLGNRTSFNEESVGPGSEGRNSEGTRCDQIMDSIITSK